MQFNSKRINKKIGNKLGEAKDLPFDSSKEGFDEAMNTIENTLENATLKSETFTTRGGDEVFDVFSEKTGMTVRIRADGTFDTLIPEASDKIKILIK